MSAIVKIYPLTPMQEGMLFHSLLQEGSTVYFQQKALTLIGQVNVPLLEQSFNHIIQRHDIFRTNFVYENVKRPRQVVLRQRTQQIAFEDYSRLSEDEAKQAADLYLEKDRERGFHLVKDALIRIAVLKITEDQHILVLSSHHIIFDGWCLGLFSSELFTAYQGLLKGQPPLLTPAFAFGDYVHWLGKQDNEAASGYWRDYLSDYTQLSSLPRLRSASAHEQPLHVEHEFHFDENLTQKLIDTARSHYVTFSTLFQTAWGLLLHLYNDNRDIVFGSVVSGRPAELIGIDEAIGLFINTVPVRIKSEGTESIADLMRRVQDEAVDSRSFEHYPLYDIQAQSSLKQNLIDHIVVFENLPFLSEVEETTSGFELGFHIEGMQEFDQTNYDLNVLVYTAEKLCVQISYNPDVYPSGLIHKLEGHLGRILQAIAEQPQLKTEDLNLLSIEEQQELLSGWADRFADYPKDAVIHQLIEQQAERTPGRIAVLYEETSLTYRELNERANQLAHILVSNGIKRDMLVAVVMERSAEIIVSILAVLKAGGAYVPIDPHYPVERIQYILDDSACRVMVTDLHLNSSLHFAGMIINPKDLSISEQSSDNLQIQYSSDQLAYIIYTSGTTGNPKGVMIEHKNVIRLMINDRNLYDFHAGDVWTMFHSTSFDFSVWEMYGALMFGGKLIVVPKFVPAHTGEFLELLERHEVTVLNQTPTAFYALIQEALANGLKKLNLRYVIFGGEALQPAMLIKWHEAYPNTRLVNMYGITETTVHVTYKEITKAEIEGGVSHIGRPIPTLSCYVLDRQGRLLPAGCIGELYVGGEGVARGYWNREELTRERFVLHPSIPGERLYRSGDLVRLLPDGEMEYMGRIDHQVKIRGFRIELGEVEAHILKHDSVKEVSVLALGDYAGEKILSAFVIADMPLTVKELRAFLSGKLPDYMIPSQFVQLDHMPMTSNGKADRRQLELLAANMDIGTEYEQPMGEIEETLHELWQEVLAGGPYGALHSFFESGGHSLKAALLANHIKKQLSVEMPLRKLFDLPTIRQQANYIETARRQVEIAIKPVEEAAFYPLSSAQKRMLILNQIDRAETSYNMPVAFRVRGQLDEVRLGQCFQDLIQRHESLRTTFPFIGNEAFQRIHDNYIAEFEKYTAREEDLAQIFNSFVRPFDLANLPLFRVGWVETAESNSILLLDMHHIITDGVSMSLLVDDLIALYEGEELPAVKLQYKDFAAWQQKRLQAGDFEEQKQYWLNRFAGPLPSLNLPTDFPRQTIQHFEGKRLGQCLSEEVAVAVQQLAKRTETTTFMVLMAALHTLLYRYTGQEDLVVGIPIAGRSHSDLERITGMFVNTLAIRSFPQGDKSFIRLLNETKEAMMGAFEHQEYAFEDLVEKLNVPRNVGRNPLFDVMLSMQNTGKTQLQFQHAELEPIGMEHAVSKFDLTLEVHDEDDRLTLYWEYSVSLFKEETIRRMMRQFEWILLQATGDKSINEIELVTAKEERQILQEFNNTACALDTTHTLAELFTKQAALTPQNAAVLFEEEVVDYRELGERSDRLARVLSAKGVKPGVYVGIMMERGPEMIVGLLGILKAGGAYVPVEPSFPAARIRHVFTTLKVELALTNASLLAKEAEAITTEEGLPFEWMAAEHVAEEWEQLSDEERGAVLIPAKADDPAYAIFTSGSTGTPKGVVVQHRPVLNLLDWVKRTFAINEKDRVLFMTSLCFDLSVYDIFGLLTAGGSVRIVKEDEVKQPRRLLQMLLEEPITFWDSAPAALQQLMPHLSEVQGRRSSLRLVFLSGDWIPLTLPPALQQAFPGVQVTALGGATEATVWSNWFPVDEVKPEWTSIPYGKPIQNARYYIVDAHGQLCPIGVPGELHIGGDCLAAGYTDPELSAARFIADPFRGDRKGTMYKTGDLARWMADGNIEFLGRIDNQVKIRGYRIEMGEIEAVLAKHPQVGHAIVMDRKDAEGQSYLCAYVVRAEQTGSELTAGELREHLSKQVPGYMLPSYFVELASIPVTANGKLDRKVLPEPAGAALGGRAVYLEARTKTEQTLVRLWEEVLGRKEIGTQDEFFELGGHSLKATVLAARMQQELGMEVPLRDLFVHTTIAKQGEHIERLQAANPEGKGYTEIPKAQAQEVYPVSSAQKRMFLLSQFEQAGTSYNIPEVLWVEGQLDAERLQQSFQRLTERHELLRTSFEWRHGEPVQRIHEQVTFPVEIVDIREAEEERKQERLDEELEQFVKPFDVSRAPLGRATIIRTGEEEWVLGVDLHHIVTDGVSMGVLVKEFSALYEGRELPEQRVQYKDYAVWQQEQREKEAYKQQQEYWLERFKGEIPVLDLPADYVRPPVQSFEGGRVTFSISQMEREGLQRLAAETGTTMYMVLLTAYYVWLWRYSSQKELVVGTPTAGRRHADTQGLLGMFVNTLALRETVEPNETFREMLLRVKAGTLQAFEHQEFAFEDLVERLQLNRDMSRNPLFDTMFDYQYSDNGRLKLQDCAVSKFEYEAHQSKFDVSLDFVEEEHALLGSLSYSSALFGQETAEQMAMHYLKMVNGLLDSPDHSLFSISMMSEEEEQKVTEGFNDTEVLYAECLTFHQRFEEQAMATPERIAVAYEGTSLTYKELNERSNQLGRFLRKQGLKPDMPAAIILDRSVNMAVAVLGVMKAGGAFLPLDLNQPAERKKMMLEDSCTELLITDQAKTVIDELEYTGMIIPMDEADWRTEDSANLVNVNKAEDLAYLIYTSGTTGQPKAVMVEHGSFMNATFAWRDAYRLDALPFRLLQMANFSFDVFCGDLSRALANGGTMIICPEELRLHPVKLHQFMRDHRITIVESTPKLLVPLMDYVFENKLALKELKLLILGSDICPPQDFHRLQTRYGGEFRIVNSYGVTEACIDSSYYESSLDAYALRVPIGKPLPNVFYYVLDGQMRPQPIGLSGELFIGGAGVARGYWNRPELTAEKFTDNPYRQGERLYRTGDMARWLPDGSIDFLGRNDDQIKLRGYRIERGEIETAILAHLNIKETIVAVQGSKDENLSLCAYLVSDIDPMNRDGITLELQKQLANRLPQYMIPQYWIYIDAIPLTRNGKADLRSLPAPGQANEGRTAYRPPGNEVERMLCQVFANVLQKEKVGMDDHFFELGGDSIKAMQLIVGLHKQHLELEIRDLFLHPRISDLTSFVRLLGNPADSALLPLPPFIEDAWIKRKPLNVWNSYRVAVSQTGWEKERVLHAFTRIIQRNELLRTKIDGSSHPSKLYIHGANESDAMLKIYEWEADTAGLLCGLEMHLADAGMGGGGIKLLHTSAKGEERLYIFAHPLLVDNKSWELLLSEFQRGYEEPADDQDDLLAEADTYEKYVTYMRARTDKKDRYGQPAELANREASASIKMAEPLETFEPIRTHSKGDLARRLTGEATHRAFNTEPLDLLMAAFYMAEQRDNSFKVKRIQAEACERFANKTSFDWSRTVGMFNGLREVALEGLRNSDTSDLIKLAKENLRGLAAEGPLDGADRTDDFGLTYVSAPSIEPYIELAERYFQRGQHPVQTQHQLIVLCAEEEVLLYLIKQMKPGCTTNTERWMSDYAESLDEMIAHCENSCGTELTPSDLSSRHIDMKDIEDIYGLLEDMPL